MTRKKSAHAARETVALSETIDDSIKRWVAKRKTALVVEIIGIVSYFAFRLNLT